MFDKQNDKTSETLYRKIEVPFYLVTKNDKINEGKLAKLSLETNTCFVKKGLGLSAETRVPKNYNFNNFNNFAPPSIYIRYFPCVHRHQAWDQAPSSLEGSTNFGSIVIIHFGALVSALGTAQLKKIAAINRVLFQKN